MKSSIRAVAARCFPAALITMLAIGFGAAAETSADETMVIDLAVPNAREQWAFTSEAGVRSDGELVLDGRAQLVSGFFTPYEWKDVSLRASFRVEPQEQGVLACGFIVRATADGSAYYYVHFDRDQAILVRADKSNAWNEIARVGGLNKPAGDWHTAELTCIGNSFTVSLNGNELFKASDETLSRGRIGFYGSQGVVHVKDIVVEGKPLQPQTKLAIARPNHAIVCHDAGAGGYEAFPDVCRLRDGRLMCVVYASYDHIGMPKAGMPNGGRIAYCLSSDEGRTWSQPEVLFDSPDDDRDPSIVQLKNGRLICTFFTLRRNADRNLPCPDPCREPFTAMGTWMVTSDDVGKTWSEPQCVVADYFVSSPVRVLSTGKLVMPLYSEKAGTAFGAVCTSDDGGKTWSKPLDLDNAGKTLDAETDMIETKPGELYAAMRGSSCPMHFATSRNNGATWSSATGAGFIAHSPYLHRTTDGDILLGYRQVTGHTNTALRVSRDGCQTWSDPVVIDEVGGAYPSMVNLNDGSVLVVYYEEGSASNIRAKRFRVTKTGVEFLAMGTK